MALRVRPILLAGASVLTALAATEVGLRLADYGGRVPVLDIDPNAADAVAQGVFVEDQRLFWRVGDGDAWADSIRHVSAGGPPRTAPAGDTLRVLCLGDSCTYFGDPPVVPYSVLLERSFQGPREVAVLNAGVPGYTTHQGRVWLEAGLLEAAPRLVTVYFGWNDHWRAHSRPDAEYARSWERSPLRLLRLLAHALGDAGRNPSDARRVPHGDFVENLRAIEAAVTGAGARCVFITGPGRFVQEFQDLRVRRGFLAPGDDAMALHARYMDAVRAMADSRSTVLDLDAVFEAREDEAELLRADGIHLSGKGLILAARLLLEHIREHRLLR